MDVGSTTPSVCSDAALNTIGVVSSVAEGFGTPEPVGHAAGLPVVQLQGEDIECGQIMGQRKIIRPESGRPYLGPLEMINDPPFMPHGSSVQSEGRMIGVLPVRGTRQ